MEELFALRPGRYRHFKGNEYELLYVARHSETLEPMVVYRALYGERGKETTPLKELSPLERRAALLKVFFWQEKYYRGERRVLLVDDIYTSGATADACTRILKKHGIEKVYVLTMAIGRGDS